MQKAENNSAAATKDAHTEANASAAVNATTGNAQEQQKQRSIAEPEKRLPFDYSVKLPDGASERQKELAKEIEEERRKKGAIINDVRRMKRKLAYKVAEKEATAKLVAQGKKSTKNIGYLRRRKENLEFRISTEAYTLEAERELIRKKSAIDAELDEAIKSYRMRRKSEFIDGDIAGLNKTIEERSKALDEIEKKLDLLYGELRRLNGEMRHHSTPRPERKKQEQQKPIEVSLADIAIIKGKKKEEREDSD